MINDKAPDGYKQSSIGLIPNDWKTQTLGELATINPSKPQLGDNEAVTFLGMADVSEDGKVIGGVTKLYSEVSSGFTSFADNDVLVAKITPCFENGKGAHVSELENGTGFGSTEFHVLRVKPDSADASFVYRTVYTEPFRALGERNMVGSAGQRRVPADFIRSYVIAVPPLPEQKKIARILSSVDSKLALIDQQITTTQTLKKGLMQKLFTQGVGTQDADGRWQLHTEFQETELGRIPVGWKCLPLSKVARISSGGTPARSEPSYWNGEIPWVTTGEIFFNTIFKTKENITVSGQENSSAKLFPVGTVLMAMYGQGKTRGQVAKLGVEATTNQACAAIMPHKGCDSNYLYLYLEMTYQKNRQSGNEGSQKNLNAAIIKSFMIPLAPFNEQKEIARILTTVDRKLEHLQTQKTQTQQLKKGLMQKLLTGQIRVQPDPQDT
ncbi:restriction endonuclease subunit S [Thalassotalea sp. G20_0]|uniref:restriction endonuclease subunit S n=1 Tax=Thalassotalea sp. G20_0 TaxID=2821093 RepID=UPI001ADD1DDB|nr:restriction endonuclease subunit S [Thalassotalea sp. G20_0]MBO9492525.1 restriction endonuclease subunit S [Thalassotalea sp. G20_0]